MDQAIQYIMSAFQIIQLRRAAGFPVLMEIARLYSTIAAWVNSDAEHPFVITDEMWAEQAERKKEALAAYQAAKPGDIPIG